MCSLIFTNNPEYFLYLIGDPAIGEGVNRFVLSRIMEKLKYGFKINLGSILN